MAENFERLISDLLLNSRFLVRPSIGGVNNSMNVNNPINNMNNSTFPVDVVNEEKTYYIYAELPGVNKKDITVDFFNNKITISVDRNKTPGILEISELKFGKFKRTLTLPICITRKETVTVNYLNGILIIKIDKLIEENNRFSVQLDN